MTKESAGEMVVRFLKALESLNPDDETSSNHIASYLYNPDSRIAEYLKKLREYKDLENPTSQQRREAGNLLEEITVLTFCGLQGINSIKSFRSAGPQYDLLVGGDGEGWLSLCKLRQFKSEVHHLEGCPGGTHRDSLMFTTTKRHPHELHPAYRF